MILVPERKIKFHDRLVPGFIRTAIFLYLKVLTVNLEEAAGCAFNVSEFVPDSYYRYRSNSPFLS